MISIANGLEGLVGISELSSPNYNRTKWKKVIPDEIKNKPFFSQSVAGGYGKGLPWGPANDCHEVRQMIAKGSVNRFGLVFKLFWLPRGTANDCRGVRQMIAKGSGKWLPRGPAMVLLLRDCLRAYYLPTYLLTGVSLFGQLLTGVLLVSHADNPLFLAHAEKRLFSNFD